MELLAFTKYKSVVFEKIITFPEFIHEKNKKVSKEVLDKLMNELIIDNEYKELFIEYLFQCHDKLGFQFDLIDEDIKDSFNNLLNIINQAITIKNNDLNSNEALFTIAVTSYCLQNSNAPIDVETSNERNRIIEDYGYSIFLEYKRFVHANKEIKQKNTFSDKRMTAPEILMILKELKIFAEFSKRGFSKSAIIDTLYQIIGTNKKNLESYYDKVIKQTKSPNNEKYEQNAKKFLNSKGY